MYLIAQYVILMWHIATLDSNLLFSFFALFVGQNLATGLWGAVFNTNTQQQKSSYISVTA
jgi:hypothetical protein